MNQKTLKTIALLAVVSTILASVIYVLNVQLFSSNRRITPIDISFLEGMILVALGALFLIGSGGISRSTQRAAAIAATASAYGAETVGPREIFRRDSWKPKGLTRLGLTLIFTGTILLVIYFISINNTTFGI